MIYLNCNILCILIWSKVLKMKISSLLIFSTIPSLEDISTNSTHSWMGEGLTLLGLHWSRNLVWNCVCVIFYWDKNYAGGEGDHSATTFICKTVVACATELTPDWANDQPRFLCQRWGLLMCLQEGNSKNKRQKTSIFEDWCIGPVAHNDSAAHSIHEWMNGVQCNWTLTKTTLTFSIA